MESLPNLDLLSVGIVVAATGVLGFSVYFSDRKSVTSRAFLFFSLMTAFWGTLTYAEYRVPPDLGLWFLRASLFFAVWQAYSLYLFFAAFPERDYTLQFVQRYVLVPIVAMTSLLTLTPYVLDHVAQLAPNGSIASIKNGPAFLLFGIVSVTLVIWGLVVFFQKMNAVHGVARRPYVEIQIGTFLTFAFIITFNFILPAFFSVAIFVVFSSLFVFPFIAFASYAILRENLFNIKVIATSTLVFILAIISFSEIIFSDTLPLIFFRTSVFILILIFGINLIKSVIREVEQREKIQKLAEELEKTNERQEGLIHFIGHEVKGFLTKAAGTFASLSEGDFGTLPETMRPLVEHALAETRQGADSVATILKAANLKKGTVTYVKEPFDLKALVADAVDKEKMAAEKKGLALTLTADDAEYQMTGDRAQINDHVLRNLIDNSINYTPSGSINVSLKREGDKIVFAVQDTGVGITDEDKAHLFTEGGHGKDSMKVNVHSTGYGLFIAKSIVEAHGGTIRADSDGAGKGSTFTAEFPAM